MLPSQHNERICITLSPDQIVGLKTLSDIVKVPRSELIRRSVDAFLVKPFDMPANRWLDDAGALGVPPETIRKVRAGVLPIEAVETCLHEIIEKRAETPDEGIERRSRSAQPTLFVSGR
jgi:hypothetical protein